MDDPLKLVRGGTDSLRLWLEEQAFEPSSRRRTSVSSWRYSRRARSQSRAVPSFRQDSWLQWRRRREVQRCPGRLSAEEDEWCVIKDSDGSTAGCHATRERALRQQRALYAQEARWLPLRTTLHRLADGEWRRRDTSQPRRRGAGGFDGGA